jgi:hypothetical protein
VAATSIGGAHDVEVGRAFAIDPRLSESGAFAGSGGNGGAAQSESRGLALGDSAVTLYDLAVGGGANGFGTRVGGSATSQAVGTGTGSSPVEVHAWAIGGGGLSSPVTRGGDASANARAEGLGSVLATSRADAGTVNTRTAGAAHARSETVGAAGSATAEALSSGGRFSFVRGIAEAPVVASAEVEARADASGSLPSATLDGSVDAFSFVTATGERPEIWGRAALGVFDRQGLDDDDDILLHSGDDIVLHAEAVFEQPSLNLGLLENLVVSFLAVEVASEDFEEIRFQIWNGETALVDEDFDEVDDAVDFFEGTLDLALGPGTVPLDLHFVLELESERAGAGFSTLFALGTIPIPEPSTGNLLLVGLLLLSTRRAGRGTRLKGGRCGCAVMRSRAAASSCRAPRG